ncbi:hypothetical protein BN1708_001730 [Verticillium longisporum]|uniref:Uncharacterized protein n=1 Tax=Verticillium longisporum TaxID=100787 RepID=A0A0G4N4G7_VERLO|nr:hypothetical protein BN1708_001730 [Verticillium longisporum]
MASLIARRAFTTSLRRMTDQGKQQITQDSKRNPETFSSKLIEAESQILGGVMVFALAGAGFYFGSSPTKSTSETHVVKAGSPWETGSKEGAYRYHPGGDTSNEPRDAPSAVNTVVVPNVTLPASTSETHVVKAGSPWETGSKEGAYRYHPGGDTSNEPRDAPSAVNTVVVPNVTLPAELHEKYNKWGKDGYP